MLFVLLTMLSIINMFMTAILKLLDENMEK